MTLLLSNILPSDRNANLPLQKYQLVCVVPTWVSMHMVQLISDTIYLFAGIAPTKTPSEPEEVQQGPGVSSSGYGPLSVLQGARTPPARSRHHR